MSFPKYENLKDSGLGWVGDIPETWMIKPFFSIFEESRQSNKGMKSKNLLSLSYGNIVRKDINTLDGLLPDSFETYQVVKPENIVFRLTDLQNDKRSLRSAIVKEEGIITSAYLAVIPKCMDPRLANYLFRSYDLSKVFYSMGGGLRQGMNFSDIKRLPIIVPPREEQQKIAAFLDHETTKIDALIAEQQRLIELLKEKRQAVISHAVTKGLNPNAPMKDSGVEWLGEVPAHWNVMKFVRCVRIAEGQVDPRLMPYREMILIAPNHIESGSGRLRDLETAEEQGAESGKYYCEPGDVIYSKIRPALRKVCITDSAAICSADMYPLRPFNGLSGEFLFWAILSEPFSRLAILESERVAMPKINRESLNEVYLVVPPQSEQKEVCQYISERIDRIDSLTETANNTMGLLSERRSALISSAVTGKIDVRGWQPSESSNPDPVLQAAEEDASYG